MIVLEVLGTPAPKGSGRAMLIGGKARHVPSGSNANRDQLRSWDANVREAAQRALEAPPYDTLPETVPLFVQAPLAVVIEFRLMRPAGHWAKRGGLKPGAPPAPATKPDADKLARSTLDALHGAVFDDDSRIVELVVRKRYAAPGNEGARITVEEWRPT